MHKLQPHLRRDLESLASKNRAELSIHVHLFHTDFPPSRLRIHAHTVPLQQRLADDLVSETATEPFYTRAVAVRGYDIVFQAVDPGDVVVRLVNGAGDKDEVYVVG